MSKNLKASCPVCGYFTRCDRALVLPASFGSPAKVFMVCRSCKTKAQR